MTIPTIEEVRALDRFISGHGTSEHMTTFHGILRSHEALLARSPEPDVVVIRDSAGAPVYAIETKTAKTGHAADDETLRVLKDMLSYQLLPDVVREHLAAYRDALIEMPTPTRDPKLYPALRLTDPLMTPQVVNEDLVWGFRSYLNEQNTVQYAMQVTFRLPGDPRIVLCGESRVGDPSAVIERRSAAIIVERLVEILTSEERRRTLHAHMLAGTQEGWTD